MNGKFTVRKAEEKDIVLLQNMIKGLAAYEKRPQDMTASPENLQYWLFEKKIATALIAQYNEGDRIRNLLSCVWLLCSRGRGSFGRPIFM